jgi:hypothetical protein
MALQEFDELFESEGAANTVDLTDASAQISEVKQLLKQDGEFFIEFFLAEELTSPVPMFHKEIWNLLTSTSMERVLLAIPRDHAKTTLSKLCVVWYLLFTHHRFCVYLSNTNAIAKNACRDIIGYLRNPNFIAVFGEVKMIKESETDSIWIFELPMGNGRIKQCILRAVGAGQQMRGINIDNQRPDIAVVDDVEDNENTDSELLQKKLDKWIFGPFIKALARNRRKLIWLGNMLQKTSLLARLSRNPKWNPVVFGAMVKNSVTGELASLWPERWPLVELVEDFEEYRGLGLTETWMCEMMNMPGHGENGFTQDQIFYQPVPTPDDISAAWITIDPAFGENAHNDNTAIVVHVLPKNGVPMSVAHVHAKGDEYWMFEETLRLAYYWNAWTWGIESVAAQKVLLTLFQLLLAGKQLNHHVELLPLKAGSGDSKVSRIRSWVAMMSAKEYALAEGDIEATNQLLSYNMKKKSNHDDLIDSNAYGPQMLELYLPLLINQFNGSDVDAASLIQYGMEVSGV